jgi:hypothetical protein
MSRFRLINDTIKSQDFDGKRVEMRIYLKCNFILQSYIIYFCNLRFLYYYYRIRSSRFEEAIKGLD